ncbi:MAG: metal-dependent hydrolase [Chitinophagales bacterium]
MKFTYYGHACFSVEIAGKKLLFDPFISPNEMAQEIDVDSIDADYILISHGHEDHVVDVESIAKRTGAKLISNYEIISWFGEKGLKGHPMNHGGKWNFSFGSVKCVNAVHSSVLPDGTYGGNPVGFVIESEEGCFYYAGDTALTLDMQLIPLTSAPLDFCILPIGDNFTMGTDEAMLASDFVECDKVIGVHFDTFGYIKIDHSEAKKIFEQVEKELILPTIGETIEM